MYFDCVTEFTRALGLHKVYGLWIYTFTIMDTNTPWYHLNYAQL